MIQARTSNSFTDRLYIKLLLIVLVPLHVWATLMILRDLEFVTDRTEVWDAIGYASYSLVYVLVESIIIALILWAISKLLPKKWKENQIISVIGSVYMILAGASMVDFAAHAFNEVRLSKQYLYGLENFTTLTYALIAGAILVSIALSLLLILRSNKAEKVFNEFLERISFLGYFYLFMDVVGLGIIVLRNVSNAL